MLQNQALQFLLSKMEATLNVKDLGISTKKSVEVCNLIRNKTIEQAKKSLQNVIDMKKAVPYKRYNTNTPHKPGMMAGRYPVKTCEVILDMLKSIEHNAHNQGLTSKLVIAHISASKGSLQWHYGRKRRRKMKRTNLKIIVKEQEK